MSDALVRSIRELVRAIALDRAYQIAGVTCRGCGLPAVRGFGYRQPFIEGISGWAGCATCRPDRDTSCDGEVETLEELSKLVALPTHKPPSAGPIVRVRSVDRRYQHVLLFGAEHDGLFVASAFNAKCRWQRILELDERVHDLSSRRAVERLMRVATGESEL